MKKELVLGPNANVGKICHVGDNVKTGDPLIVFEESSDEEIINQTLSSFGKELGQEILESSKTTLKSKYTGVVEDIRIYYTCDFDKLSSSLQKVINDYNKDIDKKKKLLKKYFDNENASSMILAPTKKIDSPDGKVKGVKVGEGVLIEFYIKYEDEANVGEKRSKLDLSKPPYISNDVSKPCELLVNS